MTEHESSLLALLARHNEAWNAHDLDGLMGLFADDCTFEASGGDEVCGTRYEGKSDVRNAFREVLTNFQNQLLQAATRYGLTPCSCTRPSHT